MMRYIFPGILILAAVGIFFGYVDPRYQEVKEFRAQRTGLEEALTRAREFQELRDQLLTRFNAFAETDVERLEELIPNNIDNIRLALDIDNVAAQFGMRIRDIQLDKEQTDQNTTTRDIAARNYHTAILTFRVQGTYEQFLAFLGTLENSLRIVDVVSIGFGSAGTDSDIASYEYTISIRTYWLKQVS